MLRRSKLNHPKNIFNFFLLKKSSYLSSGYQLIKEQPNLQNSKITKPFFEYKNENKFNFYITLLKYSAFPLIPIAGYLLLEEQEKNTRLANIFEEIFFLLRQGRIDEAFTLLLQLSLQSAEVAQIIELIENHQFSKADELASNLFNRLNLYNSYKNIKEIILASLSDANNAKSQKLKNIVADYVNETDSNKNDRVVIRIWYRSENIKEVGHVSLETNNYYVSLWPGEKDYTYEAAVKHITEHIAIEIFNFVANNHSPLQLGNVPGRYSLSLAKDIITEKRLPDNRVCLYGLNVLEINQEIKKLLENKDNVSWNILSSSPYYQGDIYNCCTLTHHLLMKGGIEKNLTIKQKLQHYAIEDYMRAVSEKFLKVNCASLQVSLWDKYNPFSQITDESLQVQCKILQMTVASYFHIMDPLQLKRFVYLAKRVEQEKQPHLSENFRRSFSKTT